MAWWIPFVSVAQSGLEEEGHPGVMLDPRLVFDVGRQDSDEVLLPPVEVELLPLTRVRHLDTEHNVVWAQTLGLVGRVRE